MTTIGTSPSNTSNGQSMQSSNGTDIPTSTVAAIGGGFVAFAIGILCGLTALRMFRVWREARAKRRNGENITFKQLWRSRGGFWGFVTGYSGEMVIVGAGGRMNDRTFLNGWTRWEQELERHLRDQINEGKHSGKTPIMCEVEIPRGGMKGLQEFQPGQDQPVGALAWSRDLKSDPVPTLDTSVLIMLPTADERGEDDEYDDLPEMAIGTFSLRPVVPLPAAPTSTVTDSVSPGMTKKDGETETIEYAPGQDKAAQWTKQNGVWVVEGL